MSKKATDINPTHARLDQIKFVSDLHFRQLKGPMYGPCRLNGTGISSEEFAALQTTEQRRKVVNQTDLILADRIGDQLTSEDVLVNLGDFCFGWDSDHIDEIIRRMFKNGAPRAIYNFRGNHDEYIMAASQSMERVAREMGYYTLAHVMDAAMFYYEPEPGKYAPTLDQRSVYDPVTWMSHGLWQESELFGGRSNTYDADNILSHDDYPEEEINPYRKTTKFVQKEKHKKPSRLRRVYCNHFPTYVWEHHNRGVPHIHGHSHGNMEDHKRNDPMLRHKLWFDVGVDNVHHFDDERFEFAHLHTLEDIYRRVSNIRSRHDYAVHAADHHGDNHV